MLVSEMRSVGNKGCLRHTLAAATLGRVHTYLIPQVTPHATHGACDPRCVHLFSTCASFGVQQGSFDQANEGFESLELLTVQCLG